MQEPNQSIRIVASRRLGVFPFPKDPRCVLSSDNNDTYNDTWRAEEVTDCLSVQHQCGETIVTSVEVPITPLISVVSRIQPNSPRQQCLLAAFLP